jgi:hypothetical protein
LPVSLRGAVPSVADPDPGFGMEKLGSGIRDEDPGSATLAVKVPYLNLKFILSTPVEPSCTVHHNLNKNLPINFFMNDIV